MMRSALVVLLPVSLGAQARECKVSPSAKWYRQQMEWMNESKATWSNDTLRQRLLSAVGRDRSLTDRVQLGAEVLVNDGTPLSQSDSALSADLKALARQRGSAWPTKSVVGARGVRALWFFAMRDTSLQRVILHRLMEAGPEESFPPDVAILEDRLRTRDGRGQLYATQIRPTGKGKVEPARTEDLAHVDMRREGALLPPLRLSRCIAASSPAANQ